MPQPRRFARRSREPRPRRPRKRFGLGDGFIAVMGVVMVALGVLGAQALLSIDNPDPRELPAVGLVPPAKPVDQVGFALSMGIEFDACDKPVDVTIVAIGTAEFWVKRAKKLEDGGEFRIVVPDKHLDGLKAWLTLDGTSGFLRPLDPLIALDEPQPLALKRRALHLGTELRATISGWGGSLRPVVVKFRADWLDHRGWGTCYLRVPALSGDMSVLTAQDAKGEATTGPLPLDATGGEILPSETGLKAPADPDLEPVRGLVSIGTGKNRVVLESSRPNADTQINGLPTWTCAQRKRAREDVVPTDTVPDVLGTIDPDSALVLSSGRIDDVLGVGDCSAVVVLEEANSPRERDIALLVVGALFSMGLGLLLDIALRRIRGRREAVA